MAGLKHSRQREAILDYLHSTKSHPTAEAVYWKVREGFPKISLGTVYRNLNLLANQGQVLRLQCGDGVEHFDGTVKPHNHFICRQCGAVMDLDMDSIDSIDQLAGENFPGEILGHEIYFYGTCGDCLKLKNMKK